MGKNDDLVMALALGVHGLNSIIEKTPVEYMSHVGKKDITLTPSKIRKNTVKGMREEDYKWLMS